MPSLLASLRSWLEDECVFIAVLGGDRVTPNYRIGVVAVARSALPAHRRTVRDRPAWIACVSSRLRVMGCISRALTFLFENRLVRDLNVRSCRH